MKIEHSYSGTRSSGMTRSGATIAYGYDQYGRLTQDGSLAYDYDVNGNRREITYPGGTTAFSLCATSSASRDRP